MTLPVLLLATYSYYPTGSVKTVTMGNSLTISYTYHISGALKTAKVETANGGDIYSETLQYEDCGDNECEPQYNGNISYMAQRIAHSNRDFVQNREVAYYYDQLNRLTKTDDLSQDYFDDFFEYDAQGRITVQRRAERADSAHGGEYAYKSGTNQLVSVAEGVGGTADGRNMAAADNFVYDSEGNLIEDKSKRLKISYDWRGMPIEFTQYPPQENTGVSDDTLYKIAMAYDGTGRRISKTLLTKSATAACWDTVKVTHYTGIGTEVREEFHNGSREKVNVVVNMPQGLGRYKVADASLPADDNASRTFEWYLKNHLGSTMLVYGTVASTDPNTADIGETKAAYDYRAFGEQVELLPHDLAKVTENFTGKEHDDEIALNYFGARYLDPMLGMWISVDPARQFASPYLYAGNGVNPVNVVDPDGNYTLNLNEDNTVAGMVDDGNLNTVSVLNVDGSPLGEFNAPPAESYFFSKTDDNYDIVGEKFDPNMQAKANEMLNLAFDAWPCDAPAWGSGGEADFKNAYYGKAHNTVGVLNNTVMTARDAGNAMWGGWTKQMYAMPYFLSRFVANAVAVLSDGRLEDSQSSSMQIWGYANFKP